MFRQPETCVMVSGCLKNLNDCKGHFMSRIFGQYGKNGLILLFPALLTGGLLMLAGDRMDGLKIGFLSLLGVVLMLRYGATRRKWWLILSVLWWLMFVLHSAVLSASWLMYDSSMDAYFVVQAIANTTPHESLEFVQSQMGAVLLGVLALVAVGWAYVWLWRRYFDVAAFVPCHRRQLRFYFVVLLVVLGVAAWAVRPIRALAPPVYWHKYHQAIQKFRLQEQEHRVWQQNWLKEAQQNGAFQNVPAQQTVVVVLSESLTSLNLQACDYPRETSPHLQKRLAELRLWCKAYSRYPSTLDALKTMLSDYAAPNDTPTRSLQAYAKQAGFKTFWLSNQDDSHLASLFGAFADVSVYTNKRSGRSSFSQDAVLLPHFQAALNDNAAKKLIIVHLIGSHPHYSARYPDDFARFPSQNEAAEHAVLQGLTYAGAGVLVKQQRNAYDNSVLYQDFILNEILTKLQGDKTAVRSLVFVSDHGNEVGHEKDFAGHSPKTEAGYRVPIVMWDSRGHLPTGADLETPIDAAHLDENVLHLMGISHTNLPQSVLWTQPDYRFAPPQDYPYWEKR